LSNNIVYCLDLNIFYSYVKVLFSFSKIKSLIYLVSIFSFFFQLYDTDVINRNMRHSFHVSKINDATCTKKLKEILTHHMNRFFKSHFSTVNPYYSVEIARKNVTLSSQKNLNPYFTIYKNIIRINILCNK
jgi:hypothetical protein